MKDEDWFEWQIALTRLGICLVVAGASEAAFRKGAEFMRDRFDRCALDL